MKTGGTADSELRAVSRLDGNGMLLLEQYNDLDMRYERVIRYFDSNGWRAPVLAPGAANTDTYTQQAITNRSGDVLLVYTQKLDDNSKWVGWVSRSQGTGWSSPLQFAASESISDITAAMNDAGTAFLVWRTDTGAFAIQVQLAGDLGPIEQLDSIPASPTVALDQQGNAIAAWTVDRDGLIDVKVKRFSTNLGWQSSTTVAGGVARWGHPLALVMDPEGNAYLYWHFPFELWSRRFDVTSGWGEPIKVGDNVGIPSGLVVGPDGVVYVLWAGPMARELWVNNYVPGNGWQVQTRVAERLDNCWPDAIRISLGRPLFVCHERDQGGLGNVWSLEAQ